MPTETDKFAHEVLHLVHRKEVDANNRIDLVVIKWASAKRPVLENRRAFRDKKTGEWKFRKMAGVGIEELDMIVKNVDVIRQHLTIGGDDSK